VNKGLFFFAFLLSGRAVYQFQLPLIVVFNRGDKKLTSYLKHLTVAALAVGFFCAGNVQAAEDKNFLLATASTGGTYYPVGVALSTLTKVKLQPSHKIGMSAISSAGSGENIKLMRDNEVQFSILHGLYGYTT
jgi:uncharacterized protein